MVKKEEKRKKRRHKKSGGKFHLHSYPSQIKCTFGIHECVYIILTQRQDFLTVIFESVSRRVLGGMNGWKYEKSL